MNYAKIAVNTQQTIHKSGGPIVLIRKRLGDYDPLAGAGLPPTPLNVPLVGVLTKPKAKTLQQFENELSAGAYTKGRVRGVLLSGLDVPKDIDLATDQLSFEDAVWGIVGANTVCPDGKTIILYDLLVAR